MSKYEGFTEGDFGTSTKKRLPIVFCLDVSGSMIAPMKDGSTRIEALNRALNEFVKTIRNDETIMQAADFAIVTFGGKVEIKEPFSPLKAKRIPRIEVKERSYTPMGEGILVALKMIEVRKHAYKERGIKYFRPWIIIITDGEPEGPNATENFDEALKEINALESQNEISVFNVAIGNDCQFESLKKLSVRNSEPLQFDELTDFEQSNIRFLAPS